MDRSGKKRHYLSVAISAWLSSAPGWFVNFQFACAFALLAYALNSLLRYLGEALLLDWCLVAFHRTGIMWIGWAIGSVLAVTGYCLDRKVGLLNLASRHWVLVVLLPGLIPMLVLGLVFAARTHSPAVDLTSADDRHGCQTPKGERMLAPEYEYVNCNPDGTLAVVVKNGKTGYLDSNLSPLIAPIYDDLGKPGMGLIAAKRFGRWGYISVRSGETIIPFQYEDAQEFKDVGSGRPLAPVKAGLKWGFINRSGNVAIPFQFDAVDNYWANYGYGFEPSKPVGYMSRDQFWGLFRPDPPSSTKVLVGNLRGVIDDSGKYVLSPSVPGEWTLLLCSTVPPSCWAEGGRIVTKSTRWVCDRDSEPKCHPAR